MKNCGIKDQPIIGQILGSDETPGILEADFENDFDLE